MEPPVTLTFRHIERSGALEERARKLGQRLARFHGHITQVHMTLEGPGGCADRRRAYLAKIDLAVPSAHIHADSLHADGVGHEDIYLALRDAFNNAKRQLQHLSSSSPRRDARAGEFR